jgi:hypothetical protein
LKDTIGDRTFADLKIPCILTAADLNSGREVLLSEGPLVDAILATIAIPGIFPAKRIGDFELVDGGTLDPVPVSAALWRSFLHWDIRPMRSKNCSAQSTKISCMGIGKQMGRPCWGWAGQPAG